MRRASSFAEIFSFFGSSSSGLSSGQVGQIRFANPPGFPAGSYAATILSTGEVVPLTVRPGITGLWQVSGRQDLDYARRMELDREYLDRWSLWLDLVILLKTIPAVLSMRGAY